MFSAYRRQLVPLQLISMNKLLQKNLPRSFAKIWRLKSQKFKPRKVEGGSTAFLWIVYSHKLYVTN